MTTQKPNRTLLAFSKILFGLLERRRIVPMVNPSHPNKQLIKPPFSIRRLNTRKDRT